MHNNSEGSCSDRVQKPTPARYRRTHPVGDRSESGGSRGEAVGSGFRRDGAVAYALPEEVAPRDWAGQRLITIVREWVRSIEPAANLVVLKTPPGSAHLVGLALDQSDLPEVVGTICGDDTIFVALRTPKDASVFAASLRSQTA